MVRTGNKKGRPCGRPFFISFFEELVHLLESPEKQPQMECQGKNRDKRFILFHSGRVAFFNVRRQLNAKSHAIRVLRNVIDF